MKLWVLTYSTQFEGETVWGVTKDENTARDWTNNQRGKVCVTDDEHIAHEFLVPDDSTGVIKEK